jgi:predicted DNA-binding transcriptional regulator AlpA
MKSDAQVAVAKKAAKLKGSSKPALLAEQIAANQAHIAEAALVDTALKNNRHHVPHAARAPPLEVRLLGKPEILAITNLTFPTIWRMMRAGTFPRSRIVGGKSMWLSTEVEAWLAALPVRVLKGDAEAAPGKVSA